MKMNWLALILIIVSIVGLFLSFFPGLGFSGANRTGFRRDFNSTQTDLNSQNSAPAGTGGFGFGGSFGLVRDALWVVVLIIGILMLVTPKRTKK